MYLTSEVITSQFFGYQAKQIKWFIDDTLGVLKICFHCHMSLMWQEGWIKASDSCLDNPISLKTL